MLTTFFIALKGVTDAALSLYANFSFGYLSF